ncbi:hypothetical protein BGZ96_004616, partial [Linnemannia gamsii]
MDKLLQELAALREEVGLLREERTPYAFANAEPPLQKLVFNEDHKELYPAGIASAEQFFSRPSDDPDVIAKTT